jgi:putative colanic acid biosynthesis glycosyltransferase
LGKCCYSYDCDKFETVCTHCPEVRSYPKSWFFDTSTRIFKLKMKSYEGFENITFTGPLWVIERAKRSALLKSKRFAVIDEAIDLENTFYPRNTNKLRERLGISSDKRVIVTVARFSTPRKGGKYYLELAKYLEKENMCFIHVGYDGSKMNLPSNFIPISYVADQDELAGYYSLADLFVCTSLADTMPNVCLEALACGTPLCGFSASGTPYVATSEFGLFTPEGKIEDLARVVVNTPKKSPERSLACREYARARYSGKVFLEKVSRVYETAFG